MKNFKKDKLLLFKTLQNLIKENIRHSNVNVYDDVDVAEVMIELKDKKRQKLLKNLSSAMDDLISDFIKDENIRKKESEYNKEQMREAVSEVSKYTD